MTSPDLDALRAQIDDLDAQIHDLLRQRFVTTAAVSAAKGAVADPRLIPRPGREAAIIAARLAAHSGAMPKRSLIRIWREIMGAACCQQGAYRVGVAADETTPLALKAREHFGTAVPLIFAPLPDLRGQIAQADIALILTDGNAPTPQGLHRIGTLESDGDIWGHLLSPFDLEAS